MLAAIDFAGGAVRLGAFWVAIVSGGAGRVVRRDWRLIELAASNAGHLREFLVPVCRIGGLPFV